jgi:CelD/BcsL family acetyltransferase involved in cellulose biosynthesis
VAAAPSLLDLSFLDPEDAFYPECVAAARAAGRAIVSRPVLRSPYIDLEGTFEDFERTLPSKFRREVRRRRRKLEEEGEVTLEVEEGRERLDELLDEGFAIEGSGWKTARGTAIASRSETDRFYRLVAAWAAARGMLELRFLRLDGRPLAFGMSLGTGGEVHVVKVGYDPEWARFAPGTLLTHAAIARAYEQGLRRYDFLGGEDPYKLDWTSQVRERLRLQAFGHTPAGLVAHAAWRYGRPLAKRALAEYAKRRGDDRLPPRASP